MKSKPVLTLDDVKKIAAAAEAEAGQGAPTPAGGAAQGSYPFVDRRRK